MKLPSWLKAPSVYFAVFAVAAALPAYLLRFRIGPVPMTVLEVVVLISIAALGIITPITHPTLSYLKSRGVSDAIRNNKLLAIGSGSVFLATIIGIIVSPDKHGALGIAKAYFWEPMVFALLVIASKPDKEKIWRAMLGGFSASAFVVILYGLLQYAHPSLIPAAWTAERRITSVYDFPNAVALYLAPLLPLFCSSPLVIALIPFAIIAIALAKSAGGLIAVAASLFFLGVWKKKTRLASIIIAIAAILIVLLLPAASGFRDQILMRDWSGRVHQIGWKESLAMLRDHPFFGAGLDGFKTVVAPYHRAQGVEIFQYPHDLFLAAWSEIGLLGLIGFVLIFVWFFKKTLRRDGPWSMVHGKFLAAAMLAILVHGLVDVPYFKNDLAMMFWLFIVLVAL